MNHGTTSSLSVALTNNGNTNVTVSHESATGAGFSAGGVSAGTTLEPNQTAMLIVAFDPAATPGVVAGALTVTSNASNSPAAISLSTTGAAPASVALS